MHFRSRLNTSFAKAITKGVAAVGFALTAVAGTAISVAGAPQAGAAPMGSAQVGDQILKGLGQPGPHRVGGHYFTSPGIDPAQQQMAPKVLVGPSTPIIVGENICTLGVVGTDAAGNKVGITAGHCGVPGTEVKSADNFPAGPIGKVERLGSPDFGIIKFNGDVNLANHYNNVNIGQLGGGAVGWSQVCKTGISTGTSCGPVVVPGERFSISHICGSVGDSGAPVYQGNRLVGIVNGGMFNLPSCTHPLQGPFHAPVAGASWDAIADDMNTHGGVGAGFKLA